MTSPTPDAETLPPGFTLTLAYTPADLLPAFDALVRFDLRLAGGLAVTKEPQLSRIRLAWWRDEITAAESESRPANDPVLSAIRTLVRRRDVTTGQLARIIEGWAEVLETLPLEPQTLMAYANGRGAGLFAAAAAIAGSSAPERAGEAFALVDFASRCSDAVSRDRALTLASALPAEALPRALRPFALLDDWARRDAALIMRGKPPLSLRQRAFSALTFAVTGPRS